jgi:hypothetical protein
MTTGTFVISCRECSRKWATSVCPSWGEALWEGEAPSDAGDSALPLLSRGAYLQIVRRVGNGVALGKLVSGAPEVGSALS